ncbi:glycosyltransferase family 2 protein (plasmid) [Coraliomargarita sp. W4R53]
MKKPLITVILPGKDVAPYVGATLASLMTQFEDPARVKVIAINDGSSDDTGERMRHHGQALEHFEVVDNVLPVGLASARNQGLARMDTDLFAFVDGDDWLAPRRLEHAGDALNALGVDFVRTDHVTVRGRERVLKRAPFPLRNRAMSPRDAILPVDRKTMVDYPYAWAGVFHRRVLDRGLAEFPEGLFTAEDRPWIWRLHLHARSFAVVDAPAIFYRRGNMDSLTQVFDHRQLDFIPAFAQTLRVVSDDEESTRFLPKLVATIMAVSAHHLARARMMSREDRATLRAGVKDLLAALPADIVSQVHYSASIGRRHRLSPYLPKAVT